MERVNKWMSAQYREVKELLADHGKPLKKFVDLLMEKETIYEDEISKFFDQAGLKVEGS